MPGLYNAQKVSGAKNKVDFTVKAQNVDGPAKIKPNFHTPRQENFFNFSNFSPFSSTHDFSTFSKQIWRRHLRSENTLISHDVFISARF